jgi:hypothetical protein
MRRFPRVWAVLHRRFPKRALKIFSSPLRLPFRHARVAIRLLFYNRAGLPRFTRPFHRQGVVEPGIFKLQR